MKFLHNKFLDKYNIKVKILTMFISLIALSCMLIKTNSITAYATDWAQVIIDSIGTSGSGGTGRVQNGISYTRTGYLCYLLTEDGATIPGMQAKAFYSPGFAALPGAGWSCHSKKGGYSASSWTAPAPWELPPFNSDKSTNVDQIKAWMKEMGSGGSQNGVQFVKDNWGMDIAQHFMDGEYVLVIETILHFQPSISIGGGGIDESYVRETIKGRLMEEFRRDHFGDFCGHNPMDLQARAALEIAAEQFAESELRGYDLSAIVERVNELLKNSGSNYKTIGFPIIGTCTDCIEYEKAVGGNTNVFASYTNNVACFAEYIEQGGIGERAGFVAWTGAVPTKISDADVKTYGVALMVIKATDDDAIHTYWPAYNSPGKEEDAQPNKIGHYNMVKVYYTKYMKNGSLDHEEQDGSPYVELNCIPTISVDEEPNEWHLEHWSTNTDLNTSISYSAVRSMTGPQHGEGASLIKLSHERNHEKCYPKL